MCVIKYSAKLERSVGTQCFFNSSFKNINHKIQTNIFHHILPQKLLEISNIPF